MSEVEAECRECSRQYSKLLSEYWYQRRQIRKMRKAFAAIECAITHKCERARSSSSANAKHIAADMSRSAINCGNEYVDERKA